MIGWSLYGGTLVCLQIFFNWSININLHHCSMHPERQDLLKTVLQHPVKTTQVELTYPLLETSSQIIHKLVLVTDDTCNSKYLGGNIRLDWQLPVNSKAHVECTKVTTPASIVLRARKRWSVIVEISEMTQWGYELMSVVEIQQLKILWNTIEPPGSKLSLKHVIFFQPYLCHLILLPSLDFEGQEPMLRCYSLSLQCTAPARRENTLDSHTPSHPCTWRCAVSANH